jgi:hypothetical protein
MDEEKDSWTLSRHGGHNLSYAERFPAVRCNQKCMHFPSGVEIAEKDDHEPQLAPERLGESPE